MRWKSAWNLVEKELWLILEFKINYSHLKMIFYGAFLASFCRHHPYQNLSSFSHKNQPSYVSNFVLLIIHNQLHLRWKSILIPIFLPHTIRDVFTVFMIFITRMRNYFSTTEITLTWFSFVLLLMYGHDKRLRQTNYASRLIRILWW